MKGMINKMKAKLPEKITEKKVNTPDIPDTINVDKTIESDWNEILSSVAWTYTEEDWLGRD